MSVTKGTSLTIAATGVRIQAATPAGIFYGVQTLRQLLPASVELRGGPAARAERARRDASPTVPRYAWRGAMLDVARHFFAADDVKRYIDLLALYKFNRLHLHLADDQGWRIEIDVVAEPDGARRQHRRWAAGRAASTRRRSTPTSSPTRASASSRSSPRSTCRATPTPRSRPTRS